MNPNESSSSPEPPEASAEVDGHNITVNVITPGPLGRAVAVRKRERGDH
jgi:hypothetical protein